MFKERLTSKIRANSFRLGFQPRIFDDDSQSIAHYCDKTSTMFILLYFIVEFEVEYVIYGGK